MSFKFLKSNQIKLYKRENSKYWQMKIKLPKQQATRLSTGSYILKDAEQIALKNYSFLNKKMALKNARLLINAGADILVSGTTIFKSNDGDIKKNINLLKLK